MRKIGFVFLLSFAVSPLFAQVSTPPKTQAPTTKAQLAQCQSDLQNSEAARSNWKDLYDRLERERATLESKNKELEARNAKLAQDLENLKTAAREVLTYTTTLDAEYRKMLVSYGSLVDQYNGLLQRANDQLSAANAQLSRRNQLSNALAMYGLMPRYNPPQRIDLNVTFSDCTKYPALCVR